jgi:hypothetical protein
MRHWRTSFDLVSNAVIGLMPMSSSGRGGCTSGRDIRVCGVTHGGSRGSNA